MASLVAQSIKESTCNARDPGSIPGWEDPLEEEMATHASVLAWRFPWTEEPGGLDSMGSQRLGHDCVTVCFILTYDPEQHNLTCRSPLVVQWLGLCTSNAGLSP